MIKLYTLVLALALVGCAHIPVNLRCPPPPQMLKVEVHNGVISGEDLANAITNHMNLWKYVHQLQKLGCTVR